MSCEMPKARYDQPVLKSQRHPKESPVVQNAKGKKSHVARKAEGNDGTPSSSKAEGVVINEK